MNGRLALSRRQATVGTKPLPVKLLTGLVFAYAVVLAFWAVGRFTRESDLVERSVDQLAMGPEQAATPVFRGIASIQGRWRSRWCL